MEIRMIFTKILNGDNKLLRKLQNFGSNTVGTSSATFAFGSVVSPYRDV
jgi:hypothetical protein